MVLFMRSLPVNSKFQIISYGSKSEYFSGNAELVPYNEANSERAIKYIEKIEANMGGNEELTPLRNAVEILKKDQSGGSKNIFLLTDGGVGIGGQCNIP